MKVYKTLANTEDVLRYCNYFHIERKDIAKATNWDDDVIKIEFVDGSTVFYRPLTDEILWPGMDISDDPEERARTCFSELLKWKIKRSGMTQGDIAKKLGITEVSLSRYVSGKGYPKIDMLYRLSEILNANPEIFYDCFKVR